MLRWDGEGWILDDGSWDSLDSLRPKVRGDCVDGPRPCPWFMCRHHLLLDVQKNGTIFINTPRANNLGSHSAKQKSSRDAPMKALDEALERLDGMEFSCSLDAAEDGPAYLEQVAERMGLSRERSRQIETTALRKLRRDWPDFLKPD